MNRRTFLKSAGAASVAAATAAVALPNLIGDQSDSVIWPFSAPVLDQGKIGSCTGNAVTQWSNTDYARAITKRTAYLTEADAVQVYDLATQLDGIPGEAPTEDTGSTGDAACDAAVQLGWLSGYRNIKPGVNSIIAALRQQPLIVGSTWLSGMFNTDANGLVLVNGDVAGGHEYVILGFDSAAGTFLCLNSWSDQWGLKGRFHVKFADLIRLIEGDSADSAVTAPIAREP